MGPVVYGEAVFGADGNLAEARVDKAIDTILEHHQVEVDAGGRHIVVQRQEFLHQTLVGLRQPLFPLKSNNNNNIENMYYTPCLRVIKPVQRRFTMVPSIPEQVI